jgi:hypothetical protein
VRPRRLGVHIGRSDCARLVPLIHEPLDGSKIL